MPQHWYDLPAGSSKFHISLTAPLTKKRIGVEIYIDHDKELYRQFASHKEDIEAEIGIKLNWQELPNKKASRIIACKDNVDITNVKDEKEQFNWLIDRTISFRKAFEKYVE